MNIGRTIHCAFFRVRIPFDANTGRMNAGSVGCGWIKVTWARKLKRRDAHTGGESLQNWLSASTRGRARAHMK